MNNVYRIGPTRGSEEFDHLSRTPKSSRSTPIHKRKIASRTRRPCSGLLSAANAILRAWISFAAIAAVATGAMTFFAICLSPIFGAATLIGWLFA